VEFDIDSHKKGTALAVVIGWSFDHDPAGQNWLTKRFQLLNPVFNFLTNAGD
jgi:hypothetical protein